MNSTLSPTRLLVALAAVGLAIGAVASCKGSTDLGQTCAMTRPCGDAGTCNIEPLKVANPDVDFVALGSAECDNLACLRTAHSENPANTPDKAMGYCTGACIDDSDCTPDFTGAEDHLRCEQLVLDPEYLEFLKTNQPELYEQTFGSGTAASYCVLPRASGP